MIFTKKWWNAVLIRMIRTAAEAALSVIGTGMVGIMDINWANLLSITLMAAMVSFLLALSSLPEAAEDGEFEVDPQKPQQSSLKFKKQLSDVAGKKSIVLTVKQKDQNDTDNNPVA